MELNIEKFTEYRDKIYDVFGRVYQYEAYKDDYKYEVDIDRSDCIDILISSKNYTKIDNILEYYLKELDGEMVICNDCNKPFIKEYFWEHKGVKGCDAYE